MRIEDMLKIWAEQTESDKGAVAHKMGYPSKCIAMASGGSSWKTLDDYEDDINYSIYNALNALIYGVDKDKGILNINEQTAVLNNHVANVIKSNRDVNIDMYYDVAKAKLRRAMEKRGFIVE